MIIALFKKFNKVRFNSVFYLFFLLVKQWQFGLIDVKKIYFIITLNSELIKILRNNYFLYYLKWLKNNDFYLYVNARLGMARIGLGWYRASCGGKSRWPDG